MLTVGGAANGTIKLSPRTRAEKLADAATPPIPLHVIEPFLTDSLIVDEAAHNLAPRIVATPENRVLLSRGDRAYARGQYSGEDAASGGSGGREPSRGAARSRRARGGAAHAGGAGFPFSALRSR